MKTTPWKEYTEHGQRLRIRAKYGFRKIGEQEPYWSVTGEIERKERSRWVEDSCGCLHEDIAKRFPELATCIRWHLSNLKSGPMHYEANALFWWEHYTGAVLPDRYARKLEGESNADYGLRLFMSTCVFGAVDSDQSIPSLSASTGDVRDWLRARLPSLLESFKRDVAPLQEGVK